MDLSPIYSQIFSVLWIVIPIAIITGVLRSRWCKGIWGEFIVNTVINYSLDRKIYRLIKNITLPTENGTTQIDHLVVSKYGVFVLETKNMKGWIFGTEHQKSWTQQIFNHKNKFQNPLHQNYKHIKTIQELFALQNDQVHSVIAFVGKSTFKTEMPLNVTKGNGYLEYIKSKNKEVLRESEVLNIISDIEKGRLERSFKTNKEHVKHVKEIIRAKENTLPQDYDQEKASLGKTGIYTENRVAKSKPTKSPSILKPLLQVLVPIGFLLSVPFVLVPAAQSALFDRQQLPVTVPSTLSSESIREQELKHSLEIQQRQKMIDQSALKPKPFSPAEIAKAQEELKERQRRLFESAFDKYYQIPENCSNWETQKEMVDCANHRIVSRREFKAKYDEGRL